MRLPVSRGVAAGGLPSSAARSALRAACGDGCAGQPLGGGEGGARPRRLSGARGGQALAGGVALGVVDVAVVPEAPDDAAPEIRPSPSTTHAACSSLAQSTPAKRLPPATIPPFGRC